MPVFQDYHSRKYAINENFFSEWSPPMAYVLGFWYADGHIRHCKSYRIIFSSRDHNHLAKIKQVMDSGHRIEAFTSRKSKHPCFRLYLHSKKIYHDLLSLGARPANSTTMSFPEVPVEFTTDFIRGYFDGDGSVFFITYKHTKNGKFYTNIRSNFTSGSKQFLESLRNILSQTLNLYYRKVCQYGPHQFKLGYAQTDTEKLLKYMYYPGHKISLQRKAIFLKEFL